MNQQIFKESRRDPVRSVNETNPKPRLAFFRWHREGLPPFLEAHLREQVQALSHFFEVKVVTGNCDYDRVCDTIQPDLCIFESGVYAGPRKITGTSSHPDIPKLGFLHADPFDSSRAAFVSDMHQWGVETYFTTSMSMAEYTPEIADRLFVWPNAIDPAVFHDHSLRKNIPVLLTGSQARHYPWRNSVSRVLTRNFPTMVTPHFGWNGEKGTERMLHGEEYARLLNASYFVPACGTMAKDVVRKHLEVPASNACLVTERTASIEALGFRDMVNCVFADESDVLDKLDHLLRDREELALITKHGHDLVHGHHTHQNRSQILQWYRLVKEFGLGVRFRQEGVSREISRQPEERIAPPPLISGGRDRKLISEGWSELRQQDPTGAEASFLKALNYFFIPEAAVGMTFSCLLRGDVGGAERWLSKLMVPVLSHHLADEPDPVHWACEIRRLTCAGDLTAAVAAAEKFPALSHPELDRIRSAISRIAGTAVGRMHPPAEPRASISPLPQMTEAEWTIQFADMLRACGQSAMASALARTTHVKEQHGVPGGRAWRRAAAAAKQVDRRLEVWRLGRLEHPLRQRARAVLSPLRGRLTSDAWSRALCELAQTEPLSAALLVRPSRQSKAARALRAGLSGNPNGPRVEVIDQRTERLPEEPGTPPFLVFVPKQASDLIADVSALRNASVVILEGTNRPYGYEVLSRLTEEYGFVLVSHDVDREDGSAVLRGALTQEQTKETL